MLPPFTWATINCYINLKVSRGRLVVQWKTVRLQIQRSGFASCLGQQMILLSRVFKCTHCLRDRNLSNTLFSGKKRKRHLWTTAVVTSFLYEKRNVAFKNWPILYYAILHTPILQPTTIPAHHLTYGGVRALIGNRPRRQGGSSQREDRYEDNRTG